MDLKTEGKRASEMLKGKVVARVTRHRAEEVCLEFTDGSRIYVDRKAEGEGLELSITGTGDDTEKRPNNK
jgi:hypothetical protein